MAYGYGVAPYVVPTGNMACVRGVAWPQGRLEEFILEISQSLALTYSANRQGRR
jgi:hypothetical protein